MLRREIFDHEGDMTVAVAQFIRFGAALVDRQFQLERRFVIDEIEKRELGKIEAIGHSQAERLLVKGQRPRLVEHADHRMYRLRHRAATPSARGPIPGPFATILNAARSGWCYSLTTSQAARAVSATRRARPSSTATRQMQRRCEVK